MQKFAYQYKNYTGQTKNYRFLTVAGRQFRFPLGKCRYVCYDEVVEEERLRLFGQIDLPIFLGTISCREYLPVDAMYDENSAVKLLSGRFQKFIHGLEEKGVQIIEKDVKIVRKADALALQGNLTVLQEAVLLEAIEEAGETESATAQME